MEYSLNDPTLKVRLQKKRNDKTNFHDTEGYFVLKIQGLKVQSHFFINNYLWITIIFMTCWIMEIYKKTINKQHEYGCKIVIPKNSDVSMIGYRCGLSQYPNLYDQK